jgi:hypothetical protein
VRWAGLEIRGTHLRNGVQHSSETGHSVVQRKRDGDDGPAPEDLSLSIQAKWTHWSFVLSEAAWLSKDIRQEGMWKKKMAFLFAYEIATTPVKLHPVDAAEVGRVKGEGDGEVAAGGHASRRPSRHRCDLRRSSHIVHVQPVPHCAPSLAEMKSVFSFLLVLA